MTRLSFLTRLLGWRRKPIDNSAHQHAHGDVPAMPRRFSDLTITDFTGPTGASTPSAGTFPTVPRAGAVRDGRELFGVGDPAADGVLASFHGREA